MAQLSSEVPLSIVENNAFAGQFGYFNASVDEVCYDTYSFYEIYEDFTTIIFNNLAKLSQLFESLPLPIPMCVTYDCDSNLTDLQSTSYYKHIVTQSQEL